MQVLRTGYFAEIFKIVGDMPCLLNQPGTANNCKEGF